MADADLRLAMSVQWDGDAAVTHDVITHLFDMAADVDRSVFVGITNTSMLITAPADAHGGVMLVERVMRVCLGALLDMRPNLDPYGQQSLQVSRIPRPRVVASRGQRRRGVLFADDDLDTVAGSSAGAVAVPSADTVALPSADTVAVPSADTVAGSSAGAVAGSSAGTVAGSSAGASADVAALVSMRWLDGVGRESWDRVGANINIE